MNKCDYVVTWHSTQSTERQWSIVSSIDEAMTIKERIEEAAAVLQIRMVLPPKVFAETTI